MDEYGIEEARTTLGDLIDRVRLAGEAFTITRYGKKVAVLVNADWYDEAVAALGKKPEGDR